MNNIRNFRKQNGLTQEELAKKLNLERSTIAKWESGHSLPRADMLPDIAKILGCTVDKLLQNT